MWCLTFSGALPGGEIPGSRETRQVNKTGWPTTEYGAISQSHRSKSSNSCFARNRYSIIQLSGAISVEWIVEPAAFSLSFSFRHPSILKDFSLCSALKSEVVLDLTPLL
jgi:hypothetical protein